MAVVFPELIIGAQGRSQAWAWGSLSPPKQKYSPQT